MKRYRITALAAMLALAFALVLPVGAYAEKTINLNDLIQDTFENDTGKAVLSRAKNDFEQPKADEYTIEESENRKNGAYGVTEICYALKNGVRGYAAPDGKKEAAVLSSSDPVVPVAERGEYYCVYDISRELGYWVRKDAVSSGYYGQNKPVTSDLREELSSWGGIKTLCITDGAILALKKDGGTKSARYEEYGVDVSNWGKLKELGTSELGNFVYGVSASGSDALKTMVYATSTTYYDIESGSGLYAQQYLDKPDTAYSLEKNDLRYTVGVKKYVGTLDRGALVLLEDGTLHTAGLGYIPDEDLWTDSYAFTQDGVWYYVEQNAQTGKRTLYPQKDGQIDWSRGRDVTEDERYAFKNIAVGIEDIQSVDPDRAFTALKSNGDVIVYGTKAEYVDNRSSTGEYTLNYDFAGTDKLINEIAGIKDGKIVMLVNTKDAIGIASLGYPYPTLHPAEYESWKNIEYAVMTNWALIAVDRDGRVYVEKDSYMPEGIDFGQYEEIEGWMEKVVCIQGDEDTVNNSYGYLLGVTEYGKVLVAGVLPNEESAEK